MGNPQNVTAGGLPSLTGENGILPKIPGEFVAEGQGRLPAPDSLPPGTRRTVELEAGWVGPVRITYENKRYKVHRTSRWIWSGVTAEHA